MACLSGTCTNPLCDGRFCRVVPRQQSVGDISDIRVLNQLEDIRRGPLVTKYPSGELQALQPQQLQQATEKLTKEQIAGGLLTFTSTALWAIHALRLTQPDSRVPYWTGRESMDEIAEELQDMQNAAEAAAQELAQVTKLQIRRLQELRHLAHAVRQELGFSSDRQASPENHTESAIEEIDEAIEELMKEQIASELPKTATEQAEEAEGWAFIC